MHLTYHPTKDSVGKTGRRTEEKIEITAAMIEAGAAAILEWRDFGNPWDLAEVAYRAMERARKDQKGDRRM